MAKTKNIDTEPKSEKQATFTVEQLRCNCKKLFGVSTTVFDGATSKCTGNYTVDNMRNIIENWLNKKIKV